MGVACWINITKGSLFWKTSHKWWGRSLQWLKNRSMKELSAFPTVPHEILQQLSGVVNIQSIRHQHRDTGPTLMPQAQNQWIHLANQLGKKKTVLPIRSESHLPKTIKLKLQTLQIFGKKKNSNCWLLKPALPHPLKPGGKSYPTPFVKQSPFVKPLAIFFRARQPWYDGNLQAASGLFIILVVDWMNTVIQKDLARMWKSRNFALKQSRHPGHPFAGSLSTSFEVERNTF